MCRGKCGGGVWPERRIKEEEEEEVGGKVCEGIEGCALPRVNVNEKRTEKRRPRTTAVGEAVAQLVAACCCVHSIQTSSMEKYDKPTRKGDDNRVNKARDF